MSHPLTRREILLGSGSIAVGALGMGAFATQEAKAVSIDETNLNIPDKSRTVNSTVQTARVNVTGKFSLNTNVTPTRIVVRLEATRGPSWTQLDAQSLNIDTREFSLSGTLTDLGSVGDADLNPTQRGQTKSVDLSTRVKITVFKDGKQLGKDIAKDSYTISITKRKAYAEMQINASGNVSIVTSDP